MFIFDSKKEFDLNLFGFYLKIFVLIIISKFNFHLI